MMNYRREVDGLRALAVIPVMLFHAGFKLFGGGFVGVDVFFVISGYLITTIILNELEQGKFSIVDFYERRARRILPLLFLVMFFSIPVAWIFLPATDMKSYSKSLVAVSFFVSNILFWNESGYFDTAADLKPLLHTWSLAVEEQYYIFFPFFLTLAWNFGRRWILVSLILLAFFSFSIAQWASIAKPAAAFYLLLTRGWELLVGAFAAFYLSKSKQTELDGRLREAGGALGLVLIAYSIFFYNKEIPFPGVYALVPVFGSVLIIIYASQKTLVGKFLGSDFFVGIGLISYGAYLWHQPLFAFYRHSQAGDLKDFYFIGLFFASFFLAMASRKLVEKPFRDRSKLSRKFVFKFSLIGFLIFISTGMFFQSRNGFEKPGRNIKPFADVRSNKNFIVLGDSHARHLVSGLVALTSGDVTNYTSGGCIPFRNVDRYDSRLTPGSCVKKMNKYLDEIIARDSDAIVVMSSMGPVYLDGTPFNGKDLARVTGLGVELVTDKTIKDKWKIFEIGLRNTLAELSMLEKSRVFFAIDIPELGVDCGFGKEPKEMNFHFFKLYDLVAEPSIDQCHVSREAYEQRAGAYKIFVKKIVSEYPKINIFDPTEHFCDALKCKGFDPDYGFLYRDVDHLSGNGSFYYAKKLINFLHAQ